METIKTLVSPVCGAKGKGGSGGGWRNPVEEQDSLQSIQYVSLLDAISEGPIVGLVSADKSIYFNETPLRTAGGKLTLNDVSWRINTGTPDQGELPYASGAESETGVGTEVTHLYPKGEGPDSGAFHFSVTNPDSTRLRVTLAVQGLYQQKTDQAHAGDVVSASVSYRVTIADANGRNLTDYKRTLKGKTTSQYLWDLTFHLSGPAPWLVTVEKTSADSESSTLVNNLYVSSYTEIVGYSFTYPNTAVVALKASAQTFSGSVPSRIYHVKGLKVQVPTNYDPQTRTYSGIWDGTFKLAWTDNPAWVLYDVITNDRFGVSKYLPHSYISANELCDRWYLYRIAQVCDELVDDGFGGKEPRYTFNLQIQGAGEAKEVIQSIASVFHGMTYWSSGLIYARADFPEDPIRTLTQANVKDGLFTYSSASQQERHSVALVKWNDPDDLGRSHVEAVYDWDAYRRLGYRPIETVAYGCTSRGQAHRHGKWLLASEETPWTVSVEMGLDGFDLVPGDVVKVADPAWMGYRAGGRVVSVNGKNVTLDAPFDSQSGEEYQLSICDTDGGEETRRVVSVNGIIVTVSEAFTKAFAPRAVWSISGSNARPRVFRVQNIKETDKASLQITLLEINPAKFDFIEKNLRLESSPSRRPLKEEVLPPDCLDVIERTVSAVGQLRQKALFSWGWSKPVFGVSQYRVRYTDSLDNVRYSDWQGETSFELTDVQPGHWIFSVQARTFDGRVSDWATSEYDMAGSAALHPEDVSGLRLSEWGYMQRDGVHISNVDVSWSLSQTPKAALEGYSVYFRYSPSSVWQLYGQTDADTGALTLENVLTGRRIYVQVRTRSRLSVLSSGMSSSLSIVGKDALPTAPENFSVAVNPRNRAELLCHWSAVSEIDCAGYRLYLNGTTAVQQTLDTQAAVSVAESGIYTVSLATVDNSGQLSSKVSKTVSVSVYPDDVTGFSAVQSLEDKRVILLSWNSVPGLDISHYEIRQGVSWDEGIAVVPKETLSSSQVRITSEGDFTWWIVAVTAAGKRSQNPVSVSGTFSLHPSPPECLSVSRDLYDSTRLVVSWIRSPDADVVSYEVRNGLVWSTAAVLAQTSENRITLTAVSSRDYIIKVRAKNAAGFLSEVISCPLSVTLEPVNVSGFQAVQDGGAVDFTWNRNPESDISGYEIREGFSWDSGSVIAAGITQAEYTTNVSFERGYRYFIKAQNRAGFFSAQAASVSLSVTDLPPKNVLVSWDDVALLDGSHDGTRWAENPATWQSVGGVWDDYTVMRWVDFGSRWGLSLEGGSTSGIWTSPVRDLLRIVNVNLACDFSTLSRTGTASVLEFRSSLDGAEWTVWKSFLPHLERLRYVQYRVRFSAERVENPPWAVVLAFVADMPDVVKAGRKVVPEEGTEIDYGFEYCTAPTVVITADGAAKRAILSGAPGVSSCAVQVVDGNGNSVSGMVNWTAYGY